MINPSYKFISHILIVAMLVVPFQTVQASLIGTEQVAAAHQAQSNREQVENFFSRTEVQSQLQALGITANTAKERVNAMTNEEIQRLSGKIDSLPAGAMSSWWAGVLIVAILIWLFYTYK